MAASPADAAAGPPPAPAGEAFAASGRDAFVARFGAVFERSPWVAQRAWERRPFADTDALHAAMVAVVETAGSDEQLALLRAHPDLAGKLARAGALDAHSAAEQAGLGLDRLPAAEYERFDALNRAYRARFGFPFIVAVRRHDRASLLAAFQRRLEHDPATERRAALAEVAAIARLRLSDMTGAA